MSYQSISIREAMERINASVNGWFLPNVQRPYVWGSRYECELYIYKLFDSLLRGYPIGGLILWNTGDEIPYREFVRDHDSDTIPRTVDKGLWGRKDKWLVYDGQQRLQTLYSCLQYTFNEKVLAFNLLFDMNDEDLDSNETAFVFIQKHGTLNSHYLRMNELFSRMPDNKVRFRRKILEQGGDLTDEEKNLIEENLDALWTVFVESDKKSLAFFPISRTREAVVDEIFERLNTGGVPLSLADLLFSRIKELNYDFEENLQLSSRKIYNRTGRGYKFDAYNILQLIYLISKNTVRVDPKKVKKKELKEFNTIWKELESPLSDFFVDFIWGQFKINSASLVPKKLAVLPLMVYFHLIHKRGIRYQKIGQRSILYLKQYFILSQLNDWNLQSIVDNFTTIIKESIEKSNEFPLPKLVKWLNETEKRSTKLSEVNFVDYKWFSLKILTPNRIYQYDPDMRGRFNPEIDHIFPKKLKNQAESYYKSADIIWNMQPVKGDINNYKHGKHPKEFFSSAEGKKYISDYDFLPTTNFEDELWDNPLEFICKRREKMIEFLREKYELEFKEVENTS